MTKIVEYQIIHRLNHEKEQFIEDVNKLIKSGWKPQGGVSFSDGWYSQAMVREEEKEE